MGSPPPVPEKIVHDFVIVHDPERIGLGHAIAVNTQHPVIVVKTVSVFRQDKLRIGQRRDAIAGRSTAVDLAQRDETVRQVEAVQGLRLHDRRTAVNEYRNREQSSGEQTDGQQPLHRSAIGIPDVVSVCHWPPPMTLRYPLARRNGLRNGT